MTQPKQKNSNPKKNLTQKNLMQQNSRRDKKRERTPVSRVKKDKFKVGDLVHARDKYSQSLLGIGIIIGPKQFLYYSQAIYDIYWTKQGLAWEYEKHLKRVSK